MNQNMTSLRGFIVSLLVCLVAAGVDADLDLFKKYQDEVLGSDSRRLEFESVRNELQLAIKLVEAHARTGYVQGEQMLSDLELLVDDCSVGDVCNPEVDFKKLDRLDKGASFRNLNPYLQDCKSVILEHCSESVNKLVESKFASFEQPKLDTVKALAKQFAWIEPRYSKVPPNYLVVLKALKSMDPKRSDKVAKKWMHRTKAAKEFISQVRQSCDAFLERYDPLVDRYPPSATAVIRQSTSASPSERLTKLRFYADSCKKIVADWDATMKDAMRNYKERLAQPKPESNWDNRMLADTSTASDDPPNLLMTAGVIAAIG